MQTANLSINPALKDSISVNTFFKYLSWVIIVIGVFIRLKLFLADHSLYIDEANVARNLYERNFSQFFKSLSYEQYFPPLLACLCKLSAIVLGYSEKGLRLIPFIGSLLNFYLIYRLVTKLNLGYFTLCMLLFLYAFNQTTITFSVVTKQYIVDYCISLLLTLTAFINWDTNKYWEKILFFSLIGCIAIWSSMSSVFVLAALGSLLFYEEIEQKNFKKAGLILIPIVLWLVNFAIYYFNILKSDANSDYLQNYHTYFFLPIPKNFDDVQHIYIVISELFSEYFMADRIRTVIIIVFWFIGLGVLLKWNKRLFWMITIPLSLTLLASFLHQYSLIPRLMLFLGLSLHLPVAYSIQKIFIDNAVQEKRKQQFIFFLGIVLSVLFCCKTSIDLAFKNFSIEMTKESIRELNKLSNQSEPLLVHDEAYPAYTYYTNYHPEATRYLHQKNLIVVHDDGMNSLENVVNNQLERSARVWLLFGHSKNEYNQEIINRLKNTFVVENEILNWRSGFISLQRKRH